MKRNTSSLSSSVDLDVAGSKVHTDEVLSQRSLVASWPKLDPSGVLFSRFGNCLADKLKCCQSCFRNERPTLLGVLVRDPSARGRSPQVLGFFRSPYLAGALMFFAEIPTLQAPTKGTRGSSSHGRKCQKHRQCDQGTRSQVIGIACLR